VEKAISRDIDTSRLSAQNAHILDLFAEDSWRNVYPGQLEVRPPAAPTIPEASPEGCLASIDASRRRV